ncbi:MAG: cyclic nucleotide-binding domain-containing protein [Gammaproteobacteria bacterium]|nr:cyclic nucleotide-binding domain-containing protein [Gammaproteobacteria bacterium]
MESVTAFLKQADIFSDFSEEKLAELEKISVCKQIERDNLLIKENSKADSIYLIMKGRFLVYSDTGEEGNLIPANFVILHPGDTVGEIAFLDEQPRSANVKALDNNCAVIEISNKKLEQIASPKFYHTLARRLSSYIRSNNQIVIETLRKELENNKKLVAMGRLITYVLLLISFYNLSLKISEALQRNPYTSMFASTTIIAIFTITLSFMIRSLPYPIKNYGLSLDKAGKIITETLLYTSILLISITGLKLFITHIILKKNIPLIDLESAVPYTKAGSPSFYLWLILAMLVYAIFVIFQEFIARGILQGSLQIFLQDKHRKLMANLIASGVFSAMHIHLSNKLALLVFFPSLFWGWLYIKQGSLLGPIISHILVGWWALFFFGLESVLA